MLQTSLPSLSQGNPSPASGKSVCGGEKVWRIREGWREARGRARDEGWERRTRGETEKGRVRAETGAEMSRRKPGQHILPPETDLCHSYKWELSPLQT